MEIQERIGSGSFTTVATAPGFQALQTDPWLELTHTFADPSAVTGVRILFTPFSYTANPICNGFASANIDHVVLNRTRLCTESQCMVSTSTPAPTAITTMAPSTAASPAPTVVSAPVRCSTLQCVFRF